MYCKKACIAEENKLKKRAFKSTLQTLLREQNTIIEEYTNNAGVILTGIGLNIVCLEENKEV